MGRLRSKTDYENLRNDRILENKARMESLGLSKAISEHRHLGSSAKPNKTQKRKNTKTIYDTTSLRRSARLSCISTDTSITKYPSLQRSNRSTANCCEQTILSKTDYENLRNERILENQARMESLGLFKAISELRFLASSAKLNKTQERKNTKTIYDTTSLRRSARLGRISTDTSITKYPSLRRSNRLTTNYCERTVLSTQVDNKEEEKRPANTPLVKVKGREFQLSPEASARRCDSKGRGTIYDPVFGICCHFCRQKKLCGEEDCKRCSDLDPDQPCLGKTDCSVCHSTNGVLCRACLKVRYGEEMEELRENKNWMCPHCIEEKGINPYWICNSSLCLKKRKMAPTGIAIHRAREMGYKSVAHLLMDELQQRNKLSR